MAKVITLSRNFMQGHPRAGEPTYFVEKVWKCLWDADKNSNHPFTNYWEEYDEIFPATSTLDNIHNHTPKIHTIRAGNRWKDKDWASLRVWSGRPYNSKQVVIMPDIRVGVQSICITRGGTILIDAKPFRIEDICGNDGLSAEDMGAWFSKLPFSGQIIHFTDFRY